MSVQKDGLGFLVADVYRLMRREFTRHIEQRALSLAQARALVYISRHEGLRQVELAELLDLQPITVGRLVDQLAAQSLVERRADPADRRAYRVHLLAAAQPHLASIGAVVDTVRRQALAGMDEREAKAVTAALLQIRRNLSQTEEVPGGEAGAGRVRA
ncbi:MAG: MarR family transcriptional regulator [Burkholderiaceae bacterium]